MIGIAGYAENRAANAVRVYALPGFKSPSLRSSQALSLGHTGGGLIRYFAMKPDAVPEASFPCERQQAGVGPATLEERWSRDSRGGVRRVRRGRITTPAGAGVL